MNKSKAMVIGMAIGAVGALAYSWLLGPATGTTYDGHYASRLDFALDEGRQAATQKQTELNARYRMERARAALPTPPSSSTPSASDATATVRDGEDI